MVFVFLHFAMLSVFTAWQAHDQRVFLKPQALALKFLDGNFWLLLSAAKFDFVYMCTGIYLIRFYVWSWWYGFWLSIEFSLFIGYSILLIPFTVCIIMNAFQFFDMQQLLLFTGGYKTRLRILRVLDPKHIQVKCGK